MNTHQRLFHSCAASLCLALLPPASALAAQPNASLDSEIPMDLNVELPPGLGADLPLELSVEMPKDVSVPASAPLEINKVEISEPKSPEQGIKIKINALRAELGGFSDSSAPDSDTYLGGAASLIGKAGAWEYALGARFDAQAQSGTPDYSRAKLDYTENYLRWRNPEMRFTVGTQNLLWGRVDEIPPTDRLSRVDLSRFVLDRLPDRRRAVPALRLESFQGDFKIDAAWVPVFDPAVMPDEKSVWHPVDTANKRILGLGTIPLPSPLMQLAIGPEDDGGSGGGGIRVTHSGGGLDYGFSVQRARQSVPYYKVTPGFPVVTLTAVHPYSWVLGGELETQIGGATWRLEAARSSDMPVTATDFSYRTEPATDVVMGVEFFPGDGETRITLQLAGHKTHTTNVLDRTEFYNLNGEIERNFAQGRWRGNLRFFNGLNDRDVYLNPKLAYLGIDQHEFYIAAHVFSGDAQTLGGFHKDHDMLSIGWQAKF
jgi:hypothetical protein